MKSTPTYWSKFVLISLLLFTGLAFTAAAQSVYVGQAGAINYYSRNKNIGAVSMNADYINWFRLDKEIKHVILVQEASDDDPTRTKEKPLFETIERTGEITNEFARERGTSIFILKNAKTNINQIISEEIEERKNKP